MHDGRAALGFLLQLRAEFDEELAVGVGKRTAEGMQTEVFAIR